MIKENIIFVNITINKINLAPRITSYFYYWLAIPKLRSKPGLLLHPIRDEISSFGASEVAGPVIAPGE
jgi:hypothetical protein